MLKFMAWERNFEERVLKVRDRELKYQQLNYAIEVRSLYLLSTVYADSAHVFIGSLERYLVRSSPSLEP